MPATTFERLSSAMLNGLGRPAGTTKKQSKSQADEAQKVGILAVGIHSTPDDIADWERQLWDEQDSLLELRSKDWLQNMHYVANEPYIAWHRDQRRWIPLKTVPWRIRSKYNIVQKAVNLRTARLVENKPSVTVQAATANRDDVDKAERKEALWWFWWHKLDVHRKLIEARGWAGLCGSGFLKGGWDPDAGPACPVTAKIPRYGPPEPVLDPATGLPVPDPATGQPQMRTPYLGLEEVYLDAKRQELGPVSRLVPDPEQPGEMMRERLPEPPECDTYHEGELYLDVRASFNVRWSKYTDAISDSWYVQDAEVMPATTILGLGLCDLDTLQDATPAGGGAKALQWQGLVPLQGTTDLGSYGGVARTPSDGQRSERQILDQEYLVRQTMIWPKNAYLRKLWGEKGALLITVGGKLCGKPRPLPAWALKRCPYIQLVDLLEKGNHYAKSFLRDVIPLQDDINRSRSHMAEGMALRSRLLLGAPSGHQINIKVLGSLPGALVTYRSKEHQPTPIELGRGPEGAEGFYESSLAAAADVGMMNDASVGKLPSAGIAAKTVYALQYAEEKGIVEISAHQDTALKHLAELFDAIARHEYTEKRKIRISGEDQSFLLDDAAEVSPSDLELDADYVFTPGSMLSRQKESVKNELLQLREAGLIDDATVRRYFPAAVPDAFKVSYDAQYAKARRQLRDLIRGKLPQVAIEPWQDPGIVGSVMQEYLLSSKADQLGDSQKAGVIQLWQSAQVMLQQQQQAAAMAQAAAQGGQPGAGGGAAGGGAPTPPDNLGAPAGPSTPSAVDQMAREAEGAMGPPPTFGQPTQ